MAELNPIDINLAAASVRLDPVLLQSNLTIPVLQISAGAAGTYIKTVAGVPTWSTITSPDITKVYQSKAVDYTALVTDDFIEFTVSGKVCTLYTAVVNTSKTITIINSSNGKITIDGNGSELIIDQLTQILPRKSSVTLISNGTGWRVI